MPINTALRLLLVWTLGVSTSQGATYQSHASIREAARIYAISQLPSTDQATADVSGLDPRLRLKQCDRPIETFSTPGRSRGSRITVGVRCRGRDKWSIYVPVKIEIRKLILIANRELARNSVIGPRDLRLEERPVSRLHRGYFQDLQSVVGRTLNHALHEGDVLTPGRLQATVMIKRGSQVTILAKVGPISVRMAGTALADGAMGERIDIRNSSSNRQLEARVTGPGTVEVSM